MASEVVENLAYLSKYLDQSRAQVSELEKELTNLVCCLIRNPFLDCSNPTQVSQSSVGRARTLARAIRSYNWKQTKRNYSTSWRVFKTS
jgi:hypothetical protein